MASDENEFMDIMAASSCGSEQRDIDGHPVIVLNNAYSAVSLEKFLKAPLRSKGVNEMHRIESFVAFCDKHKGDDTALYISGGDFPSFTCIFDHSGKDEPRWQAHYARFLVKQSDQLSRWAMTDCREMPGKEFATFLERNRSDIIEPDAGKLLDIVRDIRGKANVEFAEAVDAQTGGKSIAYSEKILLKGGKDQMEIPASFRIAVPVYKRATSRTPLDCFLRFNIDEGKILLRYEIDLLGEVIEAVIDQLVEDTIKALDVPVYYGSPLNRG